MVCMVSILPLISSSSNLFFLTFEDCSKRAKYKLVSPLSSCFTAFHLSGKIQVFVYLFSFFIFLLWSSRTAKFTRRPVLFFLLINSRSGLLTRVEWSVYISKSQRILCLIFWDRFWFMPVPFVSMVKFWSPSGSSFLSSYFYFCIPFEPVCYIRLLFPNFTLLCIINICFDLISSLWCYYWRFSFFVLRFRLHSP